MTRRSLYGSLLGMVFLVNLGRTVFAPLVDPLQTSFQIDEATAGLVVTLAWLGTALPRVPVGYLLTRVARHRVVGAAGLFLAAAASMAALAPTIELLAIGGFGMGLASGAYYVAANPLVSELYPGRVGRMLGLHGTSAQLAAVAAAPVVTLALFVADYRTAFGIIAVGAFCMTILTMVIARRTSLPDAGQGDRDFVGAVRGNWRLLLTAVAIIGTVGFVWNGVFNFYVSYMIEVKGLARPTANNLLTVVFAAGVPAFAFAGRLADRLPNVPLMFAIIGAFAGSLLLLTVLDGRVHLFLGSILIGGVIHCLFPVINTFVLGSLPDENRASAYSAYSGAMMVVAATGSSVLGALLGSGVHYDVVFRGAAALVVGTLLILLGLRVTGRLPRS